MDLTEDLMATLRQRIGPVSPAPAWGELHARFRAAHAAAAELSRGLAALAEPRGGFSEWRSPATAGNASRAVNRTDLADGKSAQCIDAVIAGQPETGGRGQ
jgi:hypothetical protein